MDQNEPLEDKNPPPSPQAYASFLVRMWRDGNEKHPENKAGWQGELEHIQSGERWAFNSLEELLALLKREAEDARH
jgi:hypothetical protein